ncbi:MAG: response regulator transcription factor [SAR202 cluster bacterium]|nr:DNA-binding response regulator [Chloroflexota bacterium]MQG58351.1 response regulator transcription factor [SAR202 cluster bacterium]MQG69464.1 response regulator transcription factor [SAR202 cluster bacterium]HAL46852.1 DNA-binding response regulator [Dehalococcoidia bacterium]
MIKILIVDDHIMVRDGLASMLGRQQDFAVVGEAENGREAVQKAEELNPDVILMDLRMPEMTGVEAMKAIGERDPEAKFIVLTTYDSDEYIFDAIEAGARGYLLKDTSREELFNAVRSVHKGESQIEPGVATKVLTRLAQLSRQGSEPSPSEILSDREIEVLQLIARGSANKQIAADLTISESTVKTHVANIFQKLDVGHRTEAVTQALQRGIIKRSFLPHPRDWGAFSTARVDLFTPRSLALNPATRVLRSFV